MLISRDLYRLSQGKIRKPVPNRQISNTKSTPARIATLVLDRPQTAREFLEEVSVYIDSQTSANSDPFFVFQVHQTAFDRVIAKFPDHARQLKCVKGYYDKLIDDMSIETEEYSHAHCSGESANPTRDEIMGRHEKTQQKRVELNDVMHKLSVIIPDLKEDIVRLRESVAKTRKEVNERMSFGRHMQLSVTDFQGFAELICQKRSKKREKAAILEDELTRIRATFETATTLWMNQLNHAVALKASLDNCRRVIANLRTKELDPLHIQQMNLRTQAQRLRTDVTEINGETEQLEQGIAKLKKRIAHVRNKGRMSREAPQHVDMVIHESFSLVYYDDVLRIACE